MNWQAYLDKIIQGDKKAIARSISLVENEVAGYGELLELLPVSSKAKIIGITGPPGAGKSTLVDAMIAALIAEGAKLAIVCVDPSSPFNLGALLGDRIRMSDWYNHPDVFIRSLATRGSLGGLNPKIIEITDLLKAAPFDYIIVETVGVGQSEVEIAGLADTTVVVFVPEAGDDVQVMKAGLMEVADIFVVNKADRPSADVFARNLRAVISGAHAQHQPVPVIKTVATQKQGIDELIEKIHGQASTGQRQERKSWLLADKAFHLITDKRMKDIDKKQLRQRIRSQVNSGGFNLYRFISGYH